jgi:DNA-binding NtrC family response regulator
MINGNHVYIPAASLAMRTVERVVSDIASTSIPVLILGESGTGKEVIASQIHRLSPRREQPFTKITCASLTADFFNNRPRASLGGNGQAFEAATFWGTVLFDEIAELDMNCQARLLHALPEGEHAGASAASARGARIICTSSRNLEEELRSGRLREELYYRINGVCLRLPPLRQRRDDIPLLADFFLTKYAAIFGRTQPQLSPHVMAELCEHNWPGNVRELENVIKKVVALGDERAALSDLRAAQSELTRLTANSLSSNSLSLKDAARAASRQAEKEMILKVLSRTRWNRKRAAQELRISYKALLYKLKQIGLDDQLAR